MCLLIMNIDMSLCLLPISFFFLFLCFSLLSLAFSWWSHSVRRMYVINKEVCSRIVCKENEVMQGELQDKIA